MDILINTTRTQIFSEIDFIFPYYFSISVLFIILTMSKTDFNYEINSIYKIIGNLYGSRLF